MKVAEIKKILVPETKAFFLLNSGETVNVSVNGGNILRVAGRVMAWAAFVKKLKGWGLARLYWCDSDRPYINFRDGDVESSAGHGGRRVAGPGKKIGRPVSDAPKKKTVSFSISPAAAEKVAQAAAAAGVSKSEFLETLILNS